MPAGTRKLTTSASAPTILRPRRLKPIATALPRSKMPQPWDLMHSYVAQTGCFDLVDAMVQAVLLERPPAVLPFLVDFSRDKCNRPVVYVPLERNLSPYIVRVFCPVFFLVLLGFASLVVEPGAIHDRSLLVFVSLQVVAVDERERGRGPKH